MTLDDILIEIKKAENIAIMAHEAPDGDAIGSSLAFVLALRNMGKNAFVVMKDEFPQNFSYLPGREYMKYDLEFESPDLAIVLDCPNIKRVNADARVYFEKAKVTVEIDHHTKK